MLARENAKQPQHQKAAVPRFSVLGLSGMNANMYTLLRFDSQADEPENKERLMVIKAF